MKRNSRHRCNMELWGITPHLGNDKILLMGGNRDRNTQTEDNSEEKD